MGVMHCVGCGENSLGFTSPHFRMFGHSSPFV